MDSNQVEVRQAYSGVVVTPQQFRPAINVLGDVIGGNVDHIEQYVAAVGFHPRGLREAGTPVYAMVLDGTDDATSPLMGFKVVFYEIDLGNMLMRIEAVVPESQKTYEAQLAERLGAPLALDSLQLDLPVQFVPAGANGRWAFRCNMAPLIEKLDGFDPCSPRPISAMTGEAAANEASRDLEGMPSNPLTHAATPAELRSWAKRLMKWRPTWTFMSDPLFVQAQLVGWAPPQPMDIRAGFSQSLVEWPEVRPPFRAEGSTLVSYGEGDSPEKSPVVSVTIRRLNDPHDQPYPLPLMGNAQAQARELAATLAAVRMS